MDVRFEYTKAVNRPIRLDGRPGESRLLPLCDAQRLAADGFGTIVAAEATPELVEDQTSEDDE